MLKHVPCTLTVLSLSAFCAGTADAAIVEVNNASSNLSDSGAGNQVMETTAQTIVFNAGAADAIIVALSSETNASPGQVSITYDGFELAPVDEDGPGGTPALDQTGSGASIWLLNLSGTTYAGGNADLVLDMTGASVVNGYGLGIVSVDAGGLDIATHATSTSNAKSIDLTTTETTFNIAAHRSNSSSGGSAAQGPLTPIYAAQIGSSQGGAGYEEDVAAGTSTYTFGGSTNAPKSAAAAFVVVPEPSSLALLGLGGLLIARQRR